MPKVWETEFAQEGFYALARLEEGKIPMTIQYREKGEAGKRDEAIDGHEPLVDVPEEEITPRVAKLLAIFERPPHREESR